MTVAIQQEDSKKELAEYHNFCVILLFELGTLQDALHHEDQAIKNESTNGMSHFNKGLVL